MVYEEVINHFGSQAAVAAALGLKQPSISDWNRRGSIPYMRQLQIEQVTDGVLKAEELPYKTSDQSAGA